MCIRDRSDVMLFNIDSKGSAKVGSGKEAIVAVFMLSLIHI